MNKFFKSLICLALIISTLFALAACGKKPTLDFDEAEDNLEDEDYMVSHIDDEDDLEPGYAESLYAFDEDGNYLIIIEFKDSKSASLYYDSLKLGHEMEISELEFEIKAAELELKALEHTLKEYEDDIEDDSIEDAIDELEDEIEDLKEELEEMKKETLFGKSGKKVWAGTADAIDAANGK